MAVARVPQNASIVIVGAGPAGLMAAQAIVEAGGHATVFDAMRSAGRKFLVAGKGGLNLTHSEPLPALLDRYGAAAPRLRPYLEEFPPERVREFAKGLGAATFVGSSGRVFPAAPGGKAGGSAPLLRAWITRLRAAGVTFRMRHRFAGFSKAGLLFRDVADGRESTVSPPAAVLALGGGSWPETGSEGDWVTPLRAAGIEVVDLIPSNMGFQVAWPEGLPGAAEGMAWKNVAVSFGGERSRGDVSVTRYGVEGTPVYRLSPLLRAALARGPASLSLDLFPDLDAAALTARIAKPHGSKSLATHLKSALKLDDPKRVLLRSVPRAELADPAGLAARLKALPLPLVTARPLSEAISSAGGVAWSALDSTLMLKARPGLFVAGEMIDWEAPTGGYLLQACFSTGWAAGRAAVLWQSRP